MKVRVTRQPPPPPPPPPRPEDRPTGIPPAPAHARDLAVAELAQSVTLLVERLTRLAEMLIEEHEEDR